MSIPYLDKLQNVINHLFHNTLTIQIKIIQNPVKKHHGQENRSLFSFNKMYAIFRTGETTVKQFCFSLLGLLVLATLAGCAQNVVALSYPPPQQDVFAAERHRSVCVVDFENKRGKVAVGVRQNGDTLLPRTPVERWLAFCTAEEISRAGFPVIMAETLPEAIQAHPDYIILGEAEEVWLSESSFARYTGTVRTSISLLDGNGRHITKNSYSSVFSKTALPMSGVPKTLLDDALFEILQPAVTLLIPLMQ